MSPRADICRDVPAASTISQSRYCSHSAKSCRSRCRAAGTAQPPVLGPSGAVRARHSPTPTTAAADRRPSPRSCFPLPMSPYRWRCPENGERRRHRGRSRPAEDPLPVGHDGNALMPSPASPDAHWSHSSSHRPGPSATRSSACFGDGRRLPRSRDHGPPHGALTLLRGWRPRLAPHGDRAPVRHRQRGC